MKIEFSTSTPIYLQIVDEFKRQIAVGILKPGVKVPSQRDLAGELKVNANTIQRVYRELEVLGLVETLRGQGTFISQNPAIVELTRSEMLTTLVDDFVVAMQALGCTKDDILGLVGARYHQGKEDGQ